MLVGKNHIDSITLDGIEYHLIVVHYVDPVRIYQIQVIKGDWHVSNPEILAVTLIDETKQDQKPEDRLRNAVNLINDQLRKKMTPVTTIPETWVERLEYLILKLFFRVKEGILEIDFNL